MAIAGHISRRMLEHYSHIRLEAKRATLDRLAEETKAVTPRIEPYQDRTQAALDEERQGAKLLN
jgi:hypothetical protein